jgi:cell wall-associated NlpC family hydrolase
MSHWTDPYKGKPWVAYTTGPHSFDCWGLACAVLADDGHIVDRHLEVDVEDVSGFDSAVLAEISSGSWRRVDVSQDHPRERDVVLMARADLYNHVGIYTEANGGRILHCRKGPGVCLEPLQKLQRLGLQKFEYWRLT